MEIATLAVVLISVYFAFSFLQGFQEGKREHEPSAHHWPSLGEFDFPVVGESHYQEALRKIVGDHGDDAPKQQFVANLIPEDNNSHDKNAVRGDIADMTVGYLSRDDAPSFRRRLDRKGLKGRTTTCQALITGGFILKDGNLAHYGVQLDIKPFE